MALGAHIEAHEAGTTGTEHLTVVEGKVGLVDEEVNEFLMIESQVTAVEPDEEGGLGTEGLDVRKVLLAVVDEKVDVALHITKHLLSPLFSLLQGCKGGDGRKEMRFVPFVGCQPSVEGSAQLRIGYDCPRRDDACHVEGLGGGTKGDAHFSSLLAHRSKGDVAVAPERHVGMNLVADDDEVVLLGKVCQALQGLPFPHDARRVVGIGKDEQAGAVS